MKAAVVFPKGGAPEYVTDVAEPKPNNENELLVSVKAVSIKHLDKMRASGKHYSSETPKAEGTVPGGDCVGVLADGTRVYGLGASGTLAEKATIQKNLMVKIPNGLGDIEAAAIPNAVIGAAMGLRFKANIKPGDVVLINGATGFTGRVAVQIAKHYGAKRVIATGRNEKSLKEVMTLGADVTISLKQDDADFIAKIKEQDAQTPIDIVIDYLWGHTAEMILASLKGKGGYTHHTKYVTVGGMAGDEVKLSSSILRSTDIQLTGSGLGSWPKEQMGKLITEILPEMFQLAADGKLKVDTVEVQLKDISKIWEMDVDGGQRFVVKV